MKFRLVGEIAGRLLFYLMWISFTGLVVSCKEEGKGPTAARSTEQAPTAPITPSASFKNGTAQSPFLGFAEGTYSLGGDCQGEKIILSGDLNIEVPCDLVTSAWSAQIPFSTLKHGLNTWRLKSVRGAIESLVVEKTVYVQNVMQFGARRKASPGDTEPNDTAAFTQAIAEARTRPQSVVFVPRPTTGEDTQVFWPRYHIRGLLQVTDVHVIGESQDFSEVFAQDHLNAAIVLSGQNVSLANLNLTVDFSADPPRNSYHTSIRVLAYQARTFWIDRLKILKGSSAGILIDDSGSSEGRSVISNNLVQETRADTIHMTHKSQNIRVHQNQVFRGGDDGIAVVSYRGSDPLNITPVTRDILIEENLVADNSSHGRGITVIGGRSVTIRNNEIRNTAQSGILLASETAYNTWGVEDIVIESNRIQNGCVAPCPTKHASLSIFATKDHGIRNIKILNNTITDSRAFGAIGMQANTDDVLIQGNKIQGAIFGFVIRKDDTLSDPNYPKSTRLVIKSNEFKNIEDIVFLFANSLQGPIQIEDNHVHTVNSSMSQSVTGFMYFNKTQEARFTVHNNKVTYVNPIQFFHNCRPGDNVSSCEFLGNILSRL